MTSPENVGPQFQDYIHMTSAKSVVGIIDAIHRGEIKGLLSICFNPLVSLPNSQYVREALEKLEYYICIDFFLNETAHHADLILAGSLQEEEEGTTTIDTSSTVTSILEEHMPKFLDTLKNGLKELKGKVPAGKRL
jgi:predicted molibdopterin-dependent oxidoreductase YjgC